ncbi:MAG: TonB-dependent receptor [Candidatus Koribacter versatilis]|uniref:TonB-dependent receptor n=1 Tax=Candidatus Korobacter versatilis TaxID=658062 RepID=A0A932EQD8_9BACT|nr:TonB-dependent receptor [Candidatus Koribacter versatilis]
MRSRLFVVLSLLFILPAAFAASLTVTVTDPHHAAVSGARVTAFRGKSVAAIRQTSSAGAATFDLADGAYRVEVLAPGFAPMSLTAALPGDATLAAQLAIAVPSETVNVTAAGTPLAAESSGSLVATLGARELDLLQPVAAADAIRFLPGAVVNTSGRRGGQASLFVRGGESNYNKVILDGVPVDDPGGFFDFGVVPMFQVDRLEFFRGAQSVLYGSDAMTSVIQTWSATGSTRLPELRLGADGGTFSTARGYASLAGAWQRLDYNLFADQTRTDGQGVNDAYSNSGQGGNVGIQFGPRAVLRLRARHSNSRAGVQGAWDYNGTPFFTPDTDQRARQNNFLGSAELTVQAPTRLTHTFRVFEYSHRRFNEDSFVDPGRVLFPFPPFFCGLDCPFQAFANLNRAGFDYQGDYQPTEYLRATFGYEFEDEHGAIGELLGSSVSRGLRRNHAVWAQTLLQWKRVSFTPGFRYVHNESFGDRVVPRVALSLLAFRGGETFSGTRLRFVYSEGIKAPSFEESFGQGGGFPILPNPALKPEQATSFETGVQQSFAGGKYSASATYFHNLFRDNIDFSLDPCFCQGQYVNVNRVLAHGAEFELHARFTARLTATAGYTYLSSQILEAPFAFDPLLAAGQPLLRRPKHSGSLILAYAAKRWGADAAGTFIGPRRDSDFLGFGIDHAAGYARFDFGGWYAIDRHVTAYANVENATNRRYQEVVGYPALKANFRAGLRFVIGGE